jgi:hypothetical protein
MCFTLHPGEHFCDITAFRRGARLGGPLQKMFGYFKH